MTTHRTQVAIVGAGPSGLLLGQLLHKAGISNVILERQGAEYVLGRIRAGVLEQTTVDLLDRVGVGERMRAEGLVHGGYELCFGGERHCIDLHGLTGGKQVTVYGQTEVTRDLMDARAVEGLPTVYEAKDVALHDFDSVLDALCDADALDTCLRRVWKASRFSWWFTSLMHKFPDTGSIGHKLQRAELDYLVGSKAASTAMAENYVGLPLNA